MSDKDAPSLVPSPSGESAYIPPGARAIRDSIVHDATEIIRAREASQQKKTDFQSSTRLEPEVCEAGIRVAVYYIEGGIHKFVDFARKMVEVFGEKIKPYLKAFYNGLREMPELVEEKKGMDSYREVERLSEPKTLAAILNREADDDGERPPGEPVRKGRADE